MTKSVIGLLFAAHMCMGCAAIFKGSKQDVRFEAVPQGADVRVDGQYKGETPTVAAIDRNQANNVEVSKDGFVAQHVRVQRHPDTPWWFWDVGTCVIPVTLCVPLLVDAISGAWFSYDNEFRVKLEPKSTAAPVAPAAIAPPPNPATSTENTGL